MRTILNITTTYTPYRLGLRGAFRGFESRRGALTRSLAVEWGNRGIRLNAIAPGADSNRRSFLAAVAASGVGEFAQERIPRAGSARWKNSPTLPHFWSATAHYINGDVVSMDGGELVQGAGEFSTLVRQFDRKRVGGNEAPKVE